MRIIYLTYCVAKIITYQNTPMCYIFWNYVYKFIVHAMCFMTKMLVEFLIQGDHIGNYFKE